MKSLKQKYIFLLFTFWVMYPLFDICSQSISETEKKFLSTNFNLISEQNRLDSLNTLLNIRAENINKEKKKGSQDKDKITNLMANSISLSNQINDARKKIISLENKREELKQALRTSYDRIIDSLYIIKLSGINHSDTDIQILNYSEKKLSVIQRFPDLSFNPALILSFDPTSIKSSEERKLFADYLKKAHSEVEKKIKYIEQQYAENNEVLSLQKKAEKFIEETEYADSYRLSRNRGGSEAVLGADYNNSRDYLSNSENVKGMLNQFRAIQIGDIKPRSLLNINTADLSLKDYQKLLKELKDNLIAFNTILNHKLKSFE